MKLSLISAVAIGLASIGLVTSACSSGTDGNATPTSTSVSTDSSTSDSASSGAAPKVAKPLNAAAFVSTPCNALTDADLPALHLNGGTHTSHTTAGAPVCNWNAFDSTDPAKSYGVGIAWLVPNTTGLSSLYAQKTNQAYFTEATVDGYPAVFADLADLRSSGTCVINTAVSDSLYFSVRYFAGDPSIASQGCSLAQQTATDVIKNLGGG